MVQAKGILPRDEDREVLYRNPHMAGYFVGVLLDDALDRAGAEAWLHEVSALVDALVLRDPAEPGQDKGDKVAAVAIGLAPSFFWRDDTSPRFGADLEPPAGFATGLTPVLQQVEPLASLPRASADVMFYVASVREDRVNSFMTGLKATTPVRGLTLERGYQRSNLTEPFGYRDALRNVVPGTSRAPVAFVHRDEREADEPAWAEDGSYMAYMKIRQHPEQFNSLPEQQRDEVIGRLKDGTRLDLVGQGVEPGQEPDSVPEGLPPTAHVRKAGPRGSNDEVQIFRRGLPYMETTSDGELREGLHFCSFQASLDQFDVVFSDWCRNVHFPSASGEDPGADALLDPARGFTTIEAAGFYFVPPYQEAGLAAAVFGTSATAKKPKTGRLVVHKRVRDQADPARRFERRGFRFQVLNDQQQPEGEEFESDGTGRAVYDGVLDMEQTYTVQETFSPIANVALQSMPFTMDKPNKQLQMENVVTQPNTPYGG